MKPFALLDVSDNVALRLAKAALDTTASIAAIAVSYWLRFSEAGITARFDNDFHIALLLIGLQALGFTLPGLNTAMWRYTSIRTLSRLAAITVSSLTAVVITTYWLGIPGLPRSIVVLDGFFVLLFCGSARMATRQLHGFYTTRKRSQQPDQRVLIYGAGNAGELMLRSVQTAAEINIHVIGFVDDDPTKQGMTIHGKRILGGGDGLNHLVHKFAVSDIYVAVPSLSGADFRKLLENIHEQVGNKVNVRTLPGVMHLANGLVSIDQIRKVEIGDLLRRAPVSLDRRPVEKLLHRGTVMVVGGGGSIGSELCKQIAGFSPAHLLVVDSCEFNTYRLSEELQCECPNLPMTCLVADAGQEPMMRRIFAEYRPDFVFHAAAYKHVPLMEANPWAAAVNNLNCTLTLTGLCKPFGVKRFVLISSDKAVRPRSVMGATKRICELIVSGHSQADSTLFTAVRFGNVLGSSGSVIPKFAEQIARGGPVTVTHPEMTRYFMLIPEAVELVLQATAIAERGQTFVLDMGEPVHISDLAESMIKLACSSQNRNIEIVYTGLRPGEKLHESLYFEGDETATQVPYLLVLKEKQAADRHYVDRVYDLVARACEMDKTELLLAIRALAPEFNPQALQAPLVLQPINGHTIAQPRPAARRVNSGV
jgi:FlaA1/EpsC-like NDP-sugar epimerase